MLEGIQMSRPDSRCRACGFSGESAIGTKVSGAGWATLVVMLFICVPLCWIGLLLREQYPMCPQCGSHID